MGHGSTSVRRPTMRSHGRTHVSTCATVYNGTIPLCVFLSVACAGTRTQKTSTAECKHTYLLKCSCISLRKERHDMSTADITVLGIPGSLRAASYNRGLLRAAQTLAPDGMTIRIYDLATIPLYNADVEQRGDPEAVSDLKRAIADADALLLSTPEYQRG